MNVCVAAFYTQVNEDDEDPNSGDQSLTTVVSQSKKTITGALKDFLMESCGYSRHEAVSLLVDNGINDFERGEDSFLLAHFDKDKTFTFVITAEEMSTM